MPNAAVVVTIAGVAVAACVWWASASRKPRATVDEPVVVATPMAPHPKLDPSRAAARVPLASLPSTSAPSRKENSESRKVSPRPKRAVSLAVVPHPPTAAQAGMTDGLADWLARWEANAEAGRATPVEWVLELDQEMRDPSLSVATMVAVLETVKAVEPERVSDVSICRPAVDAAERELAALSPPNDLTAEPTLAALRRLQAIAEQEDPTAFERVSRLLLTWSTPGTPEAMRAELLVGDALLMHGRSSEALALFQNMANRRTVQPYGRAIDLELTWAQGMLLARLGRHDEALPLLARVATQRDFGHAGDALALMASTLVKEGRLDEASRHIERLEDEYPDSPFLARLRRDQNRAMARANASTQRVEVGGRPD